MIDDRHVITAAHCLLRDGKSRAPENIVVLLGAHDLSRHEFTRARVESLKYNKKYLRDTRGSDIGVIKLAEKVSFSRKVQPICLWDKKVPEGAKLVVAGWGRIDPDTPGAQVIPREAEIEVIPSKYARFVSLYRPLLSISGAVQRAEGRVLLEGRKSRVEGGDPQDVSSIRGK